MKISIIYPTRRATHAMSVLLTWMLAAIYENDLEWIVSIDTDDCKLNKRYYDDIALMKNVSLCINDNRSVVDAINNAANIAVGDVFIVISDDFGCNKAWDVDLFHALNGKSDYCVKTQDGLQPTLMTLPIMDRVYYERFGYIYHPDYRHMHSDQEMTAVAHMLGKAITLPLLFPHNHYTTGNFVKDKITIRNNSTWQQGEKLFNERLKTNFGIENPVCKYSDIVWH
jgi:hypothetical protein